MIYDGDIESAKKLVSPAKKVIPTYHIEIKAKNS